MKPGPHTYKANALTLSYVSRPFSLFTSILGLTKRLSCPGRAQTSAPLASLSQSAGITAVHVKSYFNMIYPS